MPVSTTWVSPAASGTLDLAVGAVITEGWMDSVASDLLVLGGTDGLTHTGNYTISGLAAIGTTVSNNFGLVVSPNGTLTGASQYGAVVSPTGTTGATASVEGVYATAATAATGTVGSAVAFHAASPSRSGPGATASNVYGLLVDAMNIGAGASINNYGIFVNTPSGGTGLNVGIYVAGGGITVASGGITVGTNPVMTTSNGTRNKVATGVVTSGSVGNNTATNVTVNFGFTFTTAPDVLISVSDSSDLSTINLWGVSRQSISTTNMNVQFLNRTGSTQTLFATWVAIGGA